MKTFSQQRTANGGYPTAKKGGPKFSVLIAPESATLVQGVFAGAVGSSVSNLSSSHDLVLRFAPAGLDLLNGANIIQSKDPSGQPILSYDDDTKPTAYGQYLVGTGAGGPDLSSGAFSTTDPTNMVLFNGAPYVDQVMSANVLAFICAYVPPVYNATQLDKVGFDIGGGNYAPTGTETITGALTMLIGGNGFMATDTRTATSWLTNWAPPLSTAIVPPGRITTVAASNGVSPNVPWAYNKPTPVVGVKTITSSNPVNPNWKTLVAATVPNMVNIGEGVGAGFGIYLMGIRNYSSPISQFEVNRVTAFMQATGKLPYWWDLKE